MTFHFAVDCHAAIMAGAYDYGFEFQGQGVFHIDKLKAMAI
jgi:hypothetical protein